MRIVHVKREFNDYNLNIKIETMLAGAVTLVTILGQTAQLVIFCVFFVAVGISYVHSPVTTTKF